MFKTYIRMFMALGVVFLAKEYKMVVYGCLYTG
jgi:hypothetical protein